MKMLNRDLRNPRPMRAKRKEGSGNDEKENCTNFYAASLTISIDKLFNQ
jgi:hypothetical protein